MADIKSLNQEQIKEMNRVNILNMLREYKETTKQEIASYLHLSIPTVTANINLLMEEGIVQEAGVAKSTGGRKPVILRLKADARYAFGVDITPDHIKIMVLNLYAEPIIDMDIPYEVHFSFDDVLAVVKKHIEKLCDSLDMTKDKILGIGMSLPGLVDEDQLMLLHAPNILIKNYSLKAFQEEMQLPLFIENEANIAAFAEMILGVGKNKKDLVYISITEGVGTGIIVSNKIYKGSSKKAGEFGHMRITDEPKTCNCGRTGCWEIYASKKALFRYYEELTGEKCKDLDKIFKNYHENDGVKKAIGKYMNYILIGIENIVLGLNPEYVVIGGDIAKYQNELSPFMEEVINEDSKLTDYEGTEILFSHMKDQGALLGAALLPLEHIYHFRKRYI